jgi:hypothetical protein
MIIGMFFVSPAVLPGGEAEGWFPLQLVGPELRISTFGTLPALPLTVGDVPLLPLAVARRPVLPPLV